MLAPSKSGLFYFFRCSSTSVIVIGNTSVLNNSKKSSVQGRIQRGAIGAIATPKTYESNLIHHDFVQFGKEQSRS